MKVSLGLVFLLGLTVCSPNQSAHIADSQNDTSFAGEYAEAAEVILNLSPNGIAIGEVHGQREGVEFLNAVVSAAIARGETIIVLLEIAPSEAGLDPDEIPVSAFRPIDMADKNLPFWTENVDMRATWELYDYIMALSGVPGVEISYFLDPRLNPPPNKLKAHGLAERWQIVKQARPNSYIISLSGNYHTRVEAAYPLEVTNSLCRYLEETYGYTPSCLAVDDQPALEGACEVGVSANVIPGGEIFAPWEYVIRRPDRCTRKATWVGSEIKPMR